MSKFVAYVGNSRSIPFDTIEAARKWATGQLRNDVKRSEAEIYQLIEKGRTTSPPVDWTPTAPPEAPGHDYSNTKFSDDVQQERVPSLCNGG